MAAEWQRILCCFLANRIEAPKSRFLGTSPPRAPLLFYRRASARSRGAIRGVSAPARQQAKRRDWVSSRFPHCRLRLLEIEPHVHLAVHRRRGGEVVAGLLRIARPAVDLAETEMAVDDEGPHAELGGERQRLTVVGLSV